ncbi:aldehyde dehydrogenase family protein [Magnetospirillum sp. 15-1]|uniref:aldehyde dehydrogenase family protein n=1 Tax=Magnetospirillum sp. 15-1 TaxID=1979370 RepID=UPI0018D519C8|nr:aldehyde dehydrogenase family protein [Magnetospirillum sp. 15-1]
MAFINGEMIDCGGSPSAVINPANGETVGHVRMADAKVMARAIDAAAAAGKTWGNTLAAERELILIRMADMVETRRDELVSILIDEAGSTFGKAMFEVEFTAAMLRSAAGEARRIFGHVIPSDAPGTLSLTIRRPLGVVGAIAPFNYPFLLGTKKICMALAAGNTVVLKPSEETSLIGLKSAEIFQAAGLPAGVLNVVPGDGATLGKVLVEDPRVRLISFTGSTRVGRLLATQCAGQGKKITLEMGGKSPLVVLGDADVDYAVKTAAFGIFSHQGQICMAGSRIIVEAGIYDAFLDRFVAKVKTLKMGDPRQPDTVIGPLIRRSQCAFVAERIAGAVKAGARVLCGGHSTGNFFEPTVIADVVPAMAVFREELFGPVASVIKARDAEHALELANDSCYGLSSAVLTNDLQLAMRFAQELESGIVHINSSTIEDNPHAPFGGVKDSGMGREGGQWSMEEMTETKWITIQQGVREYPF